MRAEQWMMLGIGAVGLYSIYRLTRSDTGTRTEPNPAPLGREPSRLPLPAGPSGSPPPTLSLVSGDPLRLRGGAWYKGRIETTPSAMASSFMGKDALTSLVSQTLGLGRVEVYMNPEEARGPIGQDFALANAGQGTRWFRGRLGAVAETVVARPPWLSVMWLASPPNVPVVSGYPELQGWSY